MFKLISTKLVPLTRELVNEFSSLKETRFERPLKSSRITFLKSKLIEGHFYNPKWAIAILNGVNYRVNGQHSSFMLSRLNDEDFPHTLQVIIEKFSCDNEQDLSDLFMEFDRIESTRSFMEAIGPVSSAHKELEGVKTYSITRAISGVGFVKFLLKSAPTGSTRAEKLSLISENIPFILWYNQFPRNGLLDKRAIVAAMYSTWLVWPEKATEFWNLVNNESHPNNLDPSRVLSRYYLSLGKMRRVSIPNVRMVYVKGLHAWNAYILGNTTTLKYHAESRVPKILGPQNSNTPQETFENNNKNEECINVEYEKLVEQTSQDTGLWG